LYTLKKLLVGLKAFEYRFSREGNNTYLKRQAGIRSRKELPGDLTGIRIEIELSCQ
jgi:hypothetical protein